MRSHLLEGVVRHRRARPFVYALEHDVYYLALDLDELDDVERIVAPGRAGIGRASSRCATATTSTRRPSDLRTRVPDHLRTEGEDPTGWQITLVTNPRVFGYVFNPASFYLCRDAAGSSGSWSWRSTTPMASGICTRSDPARGARRSSPRWRRTFYVSPFIETVGGYTVRVRDEASRLRITHQPRSRPTVCCSTPAWTSSGDP